MGQIICFYVNTHVLKSGASDFVTFNQGYCTWTYTVRYMQYVVVIVHNTRVVLRSIESMKKKSGLTDSSSFVTIQVLLHSVRTLGVLLQTGKELVFLNVNTCLIYLLFWLSTRVRFFWSLTQGSNRNNGRGRDRNIRQLTLSLKRVSSVASFIRK